MSDTPQNLLIRGVNWLGDAIMTLPAIMRLREALPTTRFTLLTDEKLAGLWEHTAHFDHVSPSPRVNRPSSSANASSLRVSMRAHSAQLTSHRPRSLACGHFAAHRLCRKLAKPIAHHAIAPGPKQPMQKGCYRYRVPAHQSSPAPNLSATAHHIHQYLHPQHLGASTNRSRHNLTHRRRSCIFGDQTAATLHGLIAGAEYGPAKRWPTEYFIETATQLIEQRRAHMLCLGLWRPGHRRGNCRCPARIITPISPAKPPS